MLVSSCRELRVAELVFVRDSPWLFGLRPSVLSHALRVGVGHLPEDEQKKHGRISMQLL